MVAARNSRKVSTSSRNGGQLHQVRWVAVISKSVAGAQLAAIALLFVKQKILDIVTRGQAFSQNHAVECRLPLIMNAPSSCLPSQEAAMSALWCLVELAIQWSGSLCVAVMLQSHTKPEGVYM
eukprot:5114596-Amphidinium_carterae.2